MEIYKLAYTINEGEPSLKEQYTDNHENTFEIKDCIVKDFDYKTIKTYEDACNKLGITTVEPKFTEILPELRKASLAHHKLMVIFKAINNGWVPDWNNANEYKYYPNFKMGSSVFCYSASWPSKAYANVGSRLCAYSKEISDYIACQFGNLYVDWFYINAQLENGGITIAMEDMKTIHNIACNSWKEKIIALANKYKDANPFVNKVYLPKEVVNEIIEACTPQQLPTVKGIFNK